MKCKKGLFILSGGMKTNRGLGVILDDRIPKCKKGFYAVLNRVLMVEIEV